MEKVIQIVCVDSECGIGKDGTIPWRNKEDMAHFKQTTIGHTVVMGRKTWESLKKPLGSRTNIVLSSTLNKEETEDYYRNEGYLEVYNTMDGLLERLNKIKNQIFVIGGAALYDTMMPYTKRVIMSCLDETYDCDVFYPFRNLSTFLLDSIERKSTFSLKHYTR